MDLYYFIVLFIFGTIFGSFFNVVGWRLPRGESIVKPRSHCTKCKHELTCIELIPVFSYVIQKGKCRNCHDKISLFYPIFELVTGLLFGISYLIFNMSFELLIALTFISMLLIIIISDYQTMIIPDEVLIFFGISLIIEFLIMYGLNDTVLRILNGIISFTIMLIIKKLGDFVFKKESMGGGDIKLMFIFGLYLGWTNALLSIFIASFIGLPVAIVIMHRKSSHEIPFGPFLSIAAIIQTLTSFDLNFLIDILTNI